MNFCLKSTVECGQFFYYQPKENGYLIVNGQTPFYIDNSTFKGVDEKYISNFFQQEVKHKTDVRVINQDLWQCIVSYICSSASNVNKIRKNVENIAKTFGNTTKFQNQKIHLFPTPGKINNEQKLKDCKVGYRAKYILAANQICTQKFLTNLKTLPYEDAHQQLKTIPGIGDKVADCICLFALKHHQAFPLDVHIKRHAAKMNWTGNYKQQSEQAIAHYGPLAGWHQQEIYFNARN